MVISKVISYKGAWEQFKKDNQVELAEILSALDDFFSGEKTLQELARPFLGDSWGEKLFLKGWNAPSESLLIPQQTHSIRPHGPFKNYVSAVVYLGNSDPNSWVFHTSPLEVKSKLIRVPVLLVPVNNHNVPLLKTVTTAFSLENHYHQLKAIAPLSHAYPFLILGYSKDSDQELLKIYNIESNQLLEQGNIIIDKSIEFPEDLHEAGLGILNFFGTYIREQYPNEKAKVRIEQEDKLVRLIVETKDGKSEIIEKALEEYQLIVSRKSPPEDFISDNILLLKMENQLALAEVQVKNQQRIIGLKDRNMETLTGLLTTALSNNHNISVVVNSTNSNSNILAFNQHISSSIGIANELKDILAAYSPAQKTLQELEAALEKIEKEKDPEVIKKSPAMSKFRRIVETITEGNDQLAKAIKATENGIDIARDLAGKYNSIAEWCGLPQVPKILTK